MVGKGLEETVRGRKESKLARRATRVEEIAKKVVYNAPRQHLILNFDSRDGQ